MSIVSPSSLSATPNLLGGSTSTGDPYSDSKNKQVNTRTHIDSVNSQKTDPNSIVSSTSSSVVQATTSALGQNILANLPALALLSNFFNGASTPVFATVTQDDIGPRQRIFQTKLYQLDLKVSETITYDLLPVYANITISENIFGNITGTLLFISDNEGNLEKALPATGQKPITIKWGMPLENDTVINRLVTGYIYNCTLVSGSDPHRKVFAAKFTSVEALMDLNSTICKAYVNESIRNIILDLLTPLNLKVVPEINLDHEDENNVIEKYVVSGMKSPLEAIRSVLSGYTRHSYDFFQRISDVGQQFVIQPHSTKTDTGIEYVAGKVANNEDNKNDVRDKYTLSSFKQIVNKGFDDVIDVGMLSSTVVISSPTRKRVMQETYDRQTDADPVFLNSNDKGFLPLNINLNEKELLYPNANNKIFVLADMSSQPTDFINTATTKLSERGKRKISPNYMRDALKYELNMAGNVALSPANTINIIMPASIPTEIDTIKTGKWSLTTVKHMFDREKGYLAAVEVCRDSVSDNYGTIPTV